METSGTLKADSSLPALVHVERIVRQNYNLLEQLHSFAQHEQTWDGDTISPALRSELVRYGLVKRKDGWNTLTDRGRILAGRTNRKYKWWTICRWIKWRIKEKWLSLWDA